MDRRWTRRARCPSGQLNPSDSRALNGRGERGGGGPVLQGGEDVHWLRLSTLSRGWSDAQFNDLAAQMGEVMRPLVQMLQELELSLVDAGPAPAMAEMSGLIQELKDAFSALSAQPVSHETVVQHTDLSNRAAFGLVQTCLDAGVHPGLIESVFLFYWLRTSTINANVPERFFQKLERHWDVVVDRVGTFVDQFGRRS